MFQRFRILLSLLSLALQPSFKAKNILDLLINEDFLSFLARYLMYNTYIQEGRYLPGVSAKIQLFNYASTMKCNICRRLVTNPVYWVCFERVIFVQTQHNLPRYLIIRQPSTVYSWIRIIYGLVLTMFWRVIRNWNRFTN